MYQYSIFVRSDQSLDGDISNLVTCSLADGLEKNQDKDISQPDGPTRVQVQHTDWLLARISSNITERWYNNAKDIEKIHDYQPVTGQNLFKAITTKNREITEYCRDRDGKIMLERLPTQYMGMAKIMVAIPKSLHTHDLYMYIRRVKTGLDMGRAAIVTGEQFNEMYVQSNYMYTNVKGSEVPDPTYRKIRMLAEDMIHNGFQWNEGLNICPDFCAGNSCGQGLFFIDKLNWPMWVNYNGKKMTKIADVTIPNDATVVVCRTPGGTIIKYKADRVIISNIRDL